ncbi:MAG: helix-turn-helix domain-containing protein [Pseudomonadota bacterium]
MAIELMARILARPKEEVDASEKLVLVVMADRADDDGLLWYAVDTIAGRASMTARGVQKIMDRLIAKKIIRKQSRRNRSNYWIINVDRFPAVERVKKAKEQGPVEFLDEADAAEPDLFGTGEPRSGTGERRSSTGEPGSVTGEPGSPDSLSDSLSDSLTPDALGARVVEAWNLMAAKHPKISSVSVLSETRKRGIELRAKEHAARFERYDPGERENAVWHQAIETVSKSRLLTGLKTDWSCTFDWVLKNANFIKIMEGNYGRGSDEIGGQSPGVGERSAAAAGSEARRLVERHRQRGRADAAHPR